MGRLDGKVAIITGAAGGQGAAEARLFAREGARVVRTDLHEPAEDTEGLFLRHDVTSEEDWARVVSETEDRFGRVDVLVNNAGILKFGSLADTSLDDYMAVVRVNQVGVFLGMKAVIDPMTRAGGGSIVNISSTDGIHGMPFVVSYVASKFAVTGMTKTAALELARSGIRVNSVHPGGIKTPMVGDDHDRTEAFMRKKIPLGRMGLPEEVASLVLFLASDESAYCTGAEFVVDGGWTSGTYVAGIS